MSKFFEMFFHVRTLFAFVCYLMVVAAPECNAISVEVVDRRGEPISEAQVAIIDTDAKRETIVDSNKMGVAEVRIEDGQEVTVLCAHPDYKGFVRESVKGDENIRIRLKSVSNVGSLILTKMPAELPNLTGRLTVLMDQTDQLYLYGEHMSLDDQTEKLIPWRIRKTLQTADAKHNQAEVSVIAVIAGVALIDLKQESRKPSLIRLTEGAHFIVQDRRGNPVAKAEVALLLVRNNTVTHGVTNELGEVSLTGFPDEPVVVYCGHEKYRAFRDVTQRPYGSHKIRLLQSDRIGSVVFESNSGNINGLKGRVDPILDNLDRLYMYAKNIALEGGKQQPIKFTIGKPIAAEDSEGNRCKIVVIDIKGDSSLLEYQFQ